MFRNLFSFEGRISRAKMWLLYLALSAALVPALASEIYLDGAKGFAEMRWSATPISLVMRGALVVWIAIWLLAVLAAVVKRFHDRGKGAAWLVLFYGIPIANFSFLYFTGWPIRAASLDARVAAFTLFAIMLVNNAWYLLELLALPGTKGANRFGADPLA
jgi:uncharacterized membrane protein YhaH (DUF805 family)